MCPVTYQTWESPMKTKHHRSVSFCPTDPWDTGCLLTGAGEALLSPPGDSVSAVGFRNLRIFPSLCCRCPYSRENQGQPSRVPGLQHKLKLWCSDCFILDNSLFNETEDLLLLYLNTENSTFKRCFIFVFPHFRGPSYKRTPGIPVKGGLTDVGLTVWLLAGLHRADVHL